MAHAVQHDYHLVNPSPWPLVGAIGALCLAIGAIAWMQSGPNEPGVFGLKGPVLFLIGVGLVGFTMMGWWRDVIRESLNGENRTPVVRIGFRYGMALFIASEIMFFAAWFWAFFGAALFPEAGDVIPLGTAARESGALMTDLLVGTGANETLLQVPALVGNYARHYFLNGGWPPSGLFEVQVLDPWHLPLINTLILLLSGTTVTWAHHAILHGDREGLKQGLILTVILGASFTALQAMEYHEALSQGYFSFGGNIYGATFFMATGFHGAHVIIGTIFLFVCLLRAYAGQFTPEHHFGFEAAAWYWHFVDVVWLFLFACIYVWGNGGAL